MKNNDDKLKLPESKPPQEETAKKAYEIYLKEASPKGREKQNWSDAETKLMHAGAPTLRTNMPIRTTMVI